MASSVTTMPLMPPGYWSRSRWATVRASEVFPTPASPTRLTTRTAGRHRGPASRPTRRRPGPVRSGRSARAARGRPGRAPDRVHGSRVPPGSGSSTLAPVGSSTTDPPDGSPTPDPAPVAAPSGPAPRRGTPYDLAGESESGGDQLHGRPLWPGRTVPAQGPERYARRPRRVREVRLGQAGRPPQPAQQFVEAGRTLVKTMIRSHGHEDTHTCRRWAGMRPGTDRQATGYPTDPVTRPSRMDFCR